MKGPFGSFFYRKNGSKNLVFCATGSGISPIISIMNINDFKNVLKHVESIHLYWIIQTLNFLSYVSTSAF